MRGPKRRQVNVEFVQMLFSEKYKDLIRQDRMYIGTLQNIEKRVEHVFEHGALYHFRSSPRPQAVQDLNMY